MTTEQIKQIPKTKRNILEENGLIRTSEQNLANTILWQIIYKCMDLYAQQEVEQNIKAMQAAYALAESEKDKEIAELKKEIKIMQKFLGT